MIRYDLIVKKVDGCASARVEKHEVGSFVKYVDVMEHIAELENQWISVEDRLPELEDNSVLVYFTTTSIAVVHIEDNFKNIPNGFDKEGNQLYTKWYICSGITHWMPLLDPPKE